jgi:uncharacterized membrane protein
MTPKVRRIFLAIAVLSLAGSVVSSVSLYHHYDNSPSSFCDFGGNFNCDIVNRSTYSQVWGIPVALIGILGYAGLFGLATVRRSKTETPKILLVASLAGLGFAFYLTYVEGFVLAAWCILCLCSLAMIFSITMLSAILAMSLRRESTRSC